MDMGLEELESEDVRRGALGGGISSQQDVQYFYDFSGQLNTPKHPRNEVSADVPESSMDTDADAVHPDVDSQTDLQAEEKVVLEEILPVFSEDSAPFSVEYPFLLRHEDPYLDEAGFALCNICKVKVKWKETKNISDHVLSPKHMKTQLKVNQRMSEFPWLELSRGVPACRPCKKDVSWKNLNKLKEHEESTEHQLFNKADMEEKEKTVHDTVKIEVDETLIKHNETILIQTQDIGGFLVEELKNLRNASDGNLRIICSDGTLFGHLEPFLLSTLLFARFDLFDPESPILYPEASIEDVKLALDLIYCGQSYPSSEEQRARVVQVLVDLNFIGGLADDGSMCSDVVREVFKEEKSNEWNLKEFPANSPEKICEDAKEKKRLQKPADITLAIRTRQFPDLDRVGDELMCRYCQEKVDWQERKRLSQHVKSLKHVRAKTLTKQQDDEVNMTAETDDWIDDEGLEEDEWSDEKEEYSLKRLRRTGSNLPRISLNARLQQFKDLAEFEGQVICKICKVVLDWTKRSRINEHMRSQKHIRASHATETVELNDISESDRIKIHAQAQRVKNGMRKRDWREDSSEDDLMDDTDTPFQEKLIQRMQEFPWMKKLPKVDEVRCIFCRCPVNWERKSHIMDHIKSKKHISAMEMKKNKYPEVLKKIAELKPKYKDDSEKPNNGDRFAYRIHLRQGTPAIQKLWGAALIIGTMTTQISMCYICFKLYLTQEELLNHSSIEHKDVPNKSIHSPLYNKETKEFFCNGCNKYTEAKKSLMCFLVHNLICTKKFYTSQVPLKCFKCEDRFTQYKNFREHIESAHESLLPERLMCTDCPQTFLTNEELKRHINQVHTEHIFSCSQCPSTFKNKNSLKEHVVKHHIGVKNFSCDTCGKEFYGKQNLRMHMRIHVAPENRPHACDLCGMRFIERKHLLNHQATHTNDRPHKCHLCDSRFKVRDWLSNHYIKQHSVSIKDVEAKFKHLNRTTAPVAQYFHHNHIHHQHHHHPQQ